MTCNVWVGAEGASPEERPLIIYFPGGGWNRSHRELGTQLFPFFTVDATDSFASTEQQTVPGFYEANDQLLFMTCDYPQSETNGQSNAGNDVPYWDDRPPSHHTYLQHSVNAVYQAIYHGRSVHVSTHKARSPGWRLPGCEHHLSFRQLHSRGRDPMPRRFHRC